MFLLRIYPHGSLPLFPPILLKGYPTSPNLAWPTCVNSRPIPASCAQPPHSGYSLPWSSQTGIQYDYLFVCLLPDFPILSQLQRLSEAESLFVQSCGSSSNQWRLQSSSPKYWGRYEVKTNVSFGLTLLMLSWDTVSLRGSGWPQAFAHPASTSPMLGCRYAPNTTWYRCSFFIIIKFMKWVCFLLLLLYQNGILN